MGIRMRNVEKVRGCSPVICGGPGEGVINDRYSLLTGRYGSGYQRAFFSRFVP